MIVCIPVYSGVDVLDVAGPYEMFDWAGFEIDVVAAKRGTVPVRVTKGSGNALGFHTEKTFKQARQCDALWVPGGDVAALSTLIYGSDHTYLDFIRRQAASAKYVCSVCEGAMLLAGAGLLDGYNVTTHWAFTPCFAQQFPKVIPAPGHPRYVLDRNRLTGGGISSGLDEALALIELLAGTVAAQEVQQSTQYYPDPPVSSQIPEPPAQCPVIRPPAAKPRPR